MCSFDFLSAAISATKSVFLFFPTYVWYRMHCFAEVVVSVHRRVQASKCCSEGGDFSRDSTVTGDVRKKDANRKTSGFFLKDRLVTQGSLSTGYRNGLAAYSSHDGYVAL